MQDDFAEKVLVALECFGTIPMYNTAEEVVDHLVRKGVSRERAVLYVLGAMRFARTMDMKELRELNDSGFIQIPDLSNAGFWETIFWNTESPSVDGSQGQNE